MLQIQVDEASHNEKENGVCDTDDTQLCQEPAISSQTYLEKFDISLHESIGVTIELMSSCHEIEDPNNYCSKSSFAGSDGTFSMAWPAGVHLAKCISFPMFHKFIKDKHFVVELGSGLGLVGLAFMSTVSCNLSHRKGEIRSITTVLTDVPLPSAISTINHNISLNKINLSGVSSDNLRVEPLLWGDTSMKCSIAGKTDLILASDILYNVTSDTFQALCDTISLLLHNKKNNNEKRSNNNKKCTMIISVRWRKPEEERKFFALMESTLGFKFHLILDEIENEDFKCDLDWNEFANPSCDRSNEYFTNTVVSANGVSFPLKDIEEKHTEMMTENEYLSFEAKYIQVYVGQKKC